MNKLTISHIKSIGYFVTKNILLVIKPAYSFSKRFIYLYNKLLHINDWSFSNKQPSYYKHEINLYEWIYNPSKCEFVEGGVLSRMLIKPDNNVLDLCCGDGSYTYLFFSDIAKQVDAIDFDLSAIKYAKSNYAKDNINFIYGDLLKSDFTNKHYDVIVWNSGIAYFNKLQRKTIFIKIHSWLKDDGYLYIKTPLELTEFSVSANQTELIYNTINFELEFSDLYSIYFFNKSVYKNRTLLNYILRKKVNIKEDVLKV